MESGRVNMLAFLFFAGVFALLSIPVVFFQSDWVVANMFTELPVLLIVNILLMIFFLEKEAARFRYRSMLLLILASISVLSAFLRLIPLPLGLTLAFLIPMTSAIVFGPAFGFLVGQISMLASGVFMGALGPWLPYQAFLIGFVAYVCGLFFQMHKSVYVVAIYACLMSFFYGYWTSIPYWSVALTHIQVPTLLSKIRSYNQFYMITSLIWDMTRAAGNIAVFFLFYASTVELLERAKKRLSHYTT